MEAQEAPAPEQEGGDPIQALGQGIQALVEGISQSSAPPEVKKAAGALMQSFEGLVSAMGGGGGGVQPAGAEGMAGGNPNAEMMR